MQGRTCAPCDYHTGYLFDDRESNKLNRVVNMSMWWPLGFVTIYAFLFHQRPCFLGGSRHGRIHVYDQDAIVYLMVIVKRDDMWHKLCLWDRIPWERLGHCNNCVCTNVRMRFFFFFFFLYLHDIHVHTCIHTYIHTYIYFVRIAR